MIRPYCAHDALLAAIRQQDPIPAQFHVWWLGQSGFLVQWNGRHLLLDPYLSDSLTHKYADTDKPHVRMTELVIEPQRLDFIDVVTSSHNHTDHLDGATLGPLLAANRAMEVVVPAANVEFVAARLEVPTARLTAATVDAPLTIGPWRITAIPAAHEQLDCDAAGRPLYVGYIVEFGPFALYHSGDTVLYEGLVERLQRWSLDLALLPINGRGPKRRVSGNLWGHEAAELAHASRVRCVIPCHYDMFTFNTASPDEFVGRCQALGQPHHVLRCGEAWSSPTVGPVC